MKITRERAEEIVDRLAEMTCGKREVADFLLSLPEFQEEKWIKLSEKKPPRNQMIYWYAKGDSSVSFGLGSTIGADDTLWKVMNIPAPPVKEDSELVKELKSLQIGGTMTYDRDSAITKAIEIVKKHEQKATK